MKTDIRTGAVVVMVTAASEEQALSIGQALVDERLAACANIVSPIRSIYRWKGEVQKDAEHLMIIKTRASLISRVEARVKEMHSYEVPAIITLPIVAGARSYLEWVFESTIAPQPAARKSRRQTGAPTRRT